MTPKEITEFVKKCRDTYPLECTEDKECSSDSKQALTIIDQLLEENRWIPISEPPKMGDYVLLYFGNTKMVCEVFFHKDFDLTNVTCWKLIILPETTNSTVNEQTKPA